MTKLSKNNGYSLIEVLAGLLIFSTVIIAMYSLFYDDVRFNKIHQREVIAYEKARSALYYVQKMSYTEAESNIGTYGYGNCTSNSCLEIFSNTYPFDSDYNLRTYAIISAGSPVGYVIEVDIITESYNPDTSKVEFQKTVSGVIVNE